MTLPDDKIKERIMQEGFPLQRFCAKYLQNSGWTVFEEYPVEQIFPLHDHANYSASASHDNVKTSGDIRALFYDMAKQYAICICISCKRQLKIDWSFMKAMFTENVHPILSSKMDETNVHEYRFDLQDRLDKPYPLCNIPTNLANKVNTPKEDDKIIHTVENLYLETLQSMEDYRLGMYEPDAVIKQFIFVPIIVTGASIHVYDIDESKFEIDKKDSINVAPVDYLMYKHNLPKSMQIRIWLKNSDNPYIMEQMNLFVVNYKYFQTFIKLLTKKFKTHTI